MKWSLSCLTLKPDFSAQEATTFSSRSVLIHGMTSIAPSATLDNIAMTRLTLLPSIQAGELFVRWDGLSSFHQRTHRDERLS